MCQNRYRHFGSYLLDLLYVKVGDCLQLYSLRHNTPAPYGLRELLEEVTLFFVRNPEENVFGGNVSLLH